MNQPIYEINLPKGKFQVYNGKPDFDFLKVNQIHSNIVLNENEINSHSEADGIFGNSNKILATLTADCLPIIVEGKLGHAILHAGWKGVRDQILLDENVRALIPETICIGPHISALNYEVGEDFKVNFPNSNSFKIINNKLCFDLRNEIKSQIVSNYPNTNVLDISICTFDDLKLNSFRRDKTKQRNYNVYIPNGAKT
jgi:copper oxidase (laccase) domain-containing protein